MGRCPDKQEVTVARRLGAQENFLTLHDNLSDTKIRLYYRMPTTSERQSYTSRRFVRKGKKMIDKTEEVRLADGKKILTGIREGDFEKQQGDTWVTFSSDEKSKLYDPDWKNRVEKDGADLIMLMAAQVFEGSAHVADSDDEDDAQDESGEEESQE